MQPEKRIYHRWHETLLINNLNDKEVLKMNKLTEQDRKDIQKLKHLIESSAQAITEKLRPHGRVEMYLDLQTYSNLGSVETFYTPVMQVTVSDKVRL